MMYMYTNIKPKWPDDKKFAVCLTHDVDRVKKTYQYLTRFEHFLKKLEIKNAFNEIFCFLKFYFSKDPKKDPYWNFEIIMEIERKFGVRSTFFFLNESGKISIFKPETWQLYLGRYDIKDPEVVRIIKRLHSEGWGIGLHASYKSYKDKNLLKKEKEELEKILGEQIYGIRQHYLNLDIPRTWKIQEEIGFKYDASFGFRDHVGFKENKYFPFYPFDSSFLVIPLTIMDTALFSSNKHKEDVWEKCERVIEIAEEKNALLTVLWHQELFSEERIQGWSDIYEKIIEICKEKDAWVTTAKNIAERWNLFESAFEILTSKNMLKFFLAKYKDEYIGGIMTPIYKGVITEWYVTGSREHLKLYPSDMVSWYPIEWGLENGYHAFDFGGAGKPDEEYGVRDFKKQFGGKLVNYGRYTKVHSPLKMRIAEKGFGMYRRLSL